VKNAQWGTLQRECLDNDDDMLVSGVTAQPPIGASDHLVVAFTLNHTQSILCISIHGMMLTITP